MALYNGMYRSQNLIFKIFCSCHLSKIIKNVHNSNSQQTEIDAIDIFTTELLKKKSYKWQTIQIKKKLHENKKLVPTSNVNKTIDTDTCMNNYEYDKEKLSELIDESIELHNFKKAMFLTKQCIENKICPSAEVVQKILSYCAQSGDKETIIMLQKFVQELEPEIYTMNAKFLHYLAEAAWVRGNICESVKLFDEVYTNYTYLRRKTRLMIKYLITNVMTERSEASLVILIRFAEKLANEFADYFPLSCVWQACFLSEWYSDQCKAAEILDKHEGLYSHIENKIPYVVNSALKNHQPEAVHRLFEILLKYKMKTHYTFVLHALFNYKCEYYIHLFIFIVY